MPGTFRISGGDAVFRQEVFTLASSPERTSFGEDVRWEVPGNAILPPCCAPWLGVGEPDTRFGEPALPLALYGVIGDPAAADR